MRLVRYSAIPNSLRIFHSLLQYIESKSLANKNTQIPLKFEFHPATKIKEALILGAKHTKVENVELAKEARHKRLHVT